MHEVSIARKVRKDLREFAKRYPPTAEASYIPPILLKNLNSECLRLLRMLQGSPLRTLRNPSANFARNKPKARSTNELAPSQKISLDLVSNTHLLSRCSKDTNPKRFV